MGEFANKTNEQALVALRRYFHYALASEVNPILELIGFLLEDKAAAFLLRRRHR